MFVTFAIGSVCPKPDLLITYNLMKINNHRIILHRFFFSNLPVIRVNSMTNYMGQRQVQEVAWKYMLLMSTPMTVLWLDRYAAGFSIVQLDCGITCLPVGVLCGIEEMAFCKVVVSYIYIIRKKRCCVSLDSHGSLATAYITYILNRFCWYHFHDG